MAFDLIGCEHRSTIREVPLDGDVCPRCVELGDRWVHLRVCMTCGEVGCCDSSKNKHARRHADSAEHPICRSLEPGESWMWCFVEEGFLAPGG